MQHVARRRLAESLGQGLSKRVQCRLHWSDVACITADVRQAAETTLCSRATARQAMYKVQPSLAFMSQRHLATSASSPADQKSGGGALKTILGVFGLAAVGAGICVASDDVRATGIYRYLVDNVGTPLMRNFDPETAHGLTIQLLKAGFGPVYRASASSVLKSEQVFTKNPSLSLDTPVGLAAGFDKQCDVPQALLNMGFGFVELGGVPPEPQPGNAKPRMWRYPEGAAVINCFGLNSEGAAAVSAKLAAVRGAKVSSGTGILGVNLAKNSTTPGEKAAEDYAKGVQAFAPHSNFVTINVSCPNVKWQGNQSETESIVKQVLAECDKVHAASSRKEKCLVFLKLSPDLDAEGLKAFASVALKYKIDGLILGNTTSTRPEGKDEEAVSFFANKGGLSGRPLKTKALVAVKGMYGQTKGRIPIIGCGGIENGQDAYSMIRAGANLVQLYTAMVYQGPGVVGRINEELEALLKQDGFKNVQDAVGVDARK